MDRCRLHVQSSSRYGDSNWFEVTGTSGIPASLDGKIVNKGSKTPISGATMFLRSKDSSQRYYSRISTSEGRFIFSSIPPGAYSIWSNYLGKETKEKTIRLGSGHNNGYVIEFPGSGKRPVIFVPGIMGSDKKRAGNLVIPKLPKEMPADADDLKIHDPGEIVEQGPGWDNLEDDLEGWVSNNAFEVFRCPYDWRYHPGSKEAQKYLRDKIAEAKRETGYSKVDVVAHSMGGLLVRAYIQNKGDEEKLEGYLNDIDRFAMVGTPNHGSLNVYPIWEGGEPMVADYLGGTGVGDFVGIFNYFYTRTADKLYRTMDSGGGFVKYTETPTGVFMEMIVDREDVREFVHDKIKSAASLMPAGDVFRLKNGTSDETYSDNNWLDSLNADLNHLTDKGIYLQIFGSNSTKYDTNCKINVTSDKSYYPKGEPTDPYNSENINCHGDGTVPTVSLSLDPVPKTLGDPEKGEHATLISGFREKILSFLKVGRDLESVSQSADTTTKSMAAPTGTIGVQDATADATSALTVNLDGNYAVLITDPQGQKTGVDAVNNEQYEEASGAESYRDYDNSHIIFKNPVNGDYIVKLTGTFANKIVLETSFIGVGDGSEMEVPLFFNGTEASFTIRLNTSGSPQFQVIKPQAPPANLSAKSDSGNVKLEWQDPSSGDPAQFRMYARRYDEPFFILLATISGVQNSYVASHAWDSPKYLYTMSAVNAAGSESILTDTVANQDIPVVDADSDGDGISDIIENSRCTNSMDIDSDDDGITDGFEDKNQNGIVDSGETNPCNPDTDGDGIQDGTETGITTAAPDPDGATGPLLGTDATKFQPDLDPSTHTDPLKADTDGDGIKDGDEDKNHNGRVDAGETNPDVSDQKGGPIMVPIKSKDGKSGIIFIE
jgi:hypothetical protein